MNLHVFAIDAACRLTAQGKNNSRVTKKNLLHKGSMANGRLGRPLRVLRVLRVIKRFKGLRAGKRQAWTPIRSH
jgi:hypothetical protein